jgi:hypothetical protein
MPLNIRESREEIGATQFVLLLQSVPHLGEKTLTRLLRANALQRITPEAWLARSPEEWREQDELDPRAIEHLIAHRERLLTDSAERARLARAHDLHILTCDSMTYPDRIERFDDSPPPVLTARGRLALLDSPTRSGASSSSVTFTLACSNGADAGVMERLSQLAEALVTAGGVPVTGHDRLPYQRLAIAAQRHGRPTLYVFDRGLREALGPEFDRPPFAVARIRDAVFDAGRDLALSPFRMDDHGIGANNRRRDRLIFALSDRVIAVDVNAGGEMEAQCRRAWEQGRPVFVAEGGRTGNAALRAIGCPPLPQGASWAAEVLEGRDRDRG